MGSMSRRQFGKLAAAGAGAVAAAAAGVGLNTGTAEAFAPGFIDRFRGPVYTSGTLSSLLDCMNRGTYNMKKVVTAWGQSGVYYPNPWPQAEITQVAINTPGTTLVRSYRGDGSADTRPNDWAYPIGTAIVSEIQPWYNTQNWIWIELGNEPNGYAGWVAWARATYPSWFSGHEGDPYYFPPQMQYGSTYNTNADAYIWNWRYYLDDAITKCKAAFQQRPVGQARATLVSPGLAALNPRRWYEIASDVMKRCDYIGYHVFTETDFTNCPDLNQMNSLLPTFFPTQNLLMTEYGLHSSGLTRAQKGRAYANMVHFNAPALPANTRGALYFQRAVSGETVYNIYPEGDDAYKTRITVG